LPTLRTTSLSRSEQGGHGHGVAVHDDGTIATMPNVGQCPSGSTSEAAYRVPTRRDAPVAVPKLPGKQCPSGFASEASFCVEMRRRFGGR
jgi:hypothetical protein